MSQYDMEITYIPGEDNTVADALSRIPEGAFPRESTEVSHIPTRSINAVLSITTDPSVLLAVQDGYLADEVCKKLIASPTSTHGVTTSNGLWYVRDCLLIPRMGNIREELFHLAHNVLGHFGADKLYVVLCDTYCWPNIRRDLEKAYIPSCTDCQCNKSSTRKPTRPLHPLPIPDDREDSVAMDFIGPLPLDDG